MENLIGGDREIATCVSSLTLILAFLPSFRTVLTEHFDWNNQGFPSKGKVVLHSRSMLLFPFCGSSLTWVC